MYPLLFSLGPLHIYSLGLFLIVSWCVFSFLFWKALREQAVADDSIFDLTFFATVASFLGARILYVLLYPDSFIADPLKIPALWIAPGLSLYGGLIGGFVSLFLTAKKREIRVSIVLDAIAQSLPFALSIGFFGALLDGGAIGSASSLPWAIYYAGFPESRHPIQLYEIIGIIAIAVVLLFLRRHKTALAWSAGTAGCIFIGFFAVLLFVVEFFAESRIYWWHLHPQQWISVIVFAEAAGVLVVRGGGIYALRKGRTTLERKARDVYEYIRRRHTSKA